MKKIAIVAIISAACGAFLALALHRPALRVERLHDHGWKLQLPAGHFVDVWTPGGRYVQVMSIDDRVSALVQLPGERSALDVEVYKERFATTLSQSDGWSYVDRDGDGTPEFRVNRKEHAREKLTFQTVAYEKEPNQSPQHNVGPRPSSGDSPASESPSSLGPRG